MRNIPIVFATDNNYECAVVSMTSLCIYAAKDTFYNIYVFIDNDFLYEKNMKEYMRPYSNVCDLNFINVGNAFDDSPIWTDRSTKGCYFRLVAPWLLTEKKCLYLDTDIIVLSDLQDLYDISLDDHYVAGCKDPVLAYVTDMGNEAWCKQAELPDLEQYINSGVLLMNLDKMRQDDIVNKFIEKIPKNMKFPDQDIINGVCYGKIKFFPLEYNARTNLVKANINCEDVYEKNELHTAWNAPKIIHYAGPLKPWNNLNCAYGDYWWEICKMTPLWEKFFDNLKYEFYFKAIYASSGAGITTKKVSKWYEITEDRKYVIYGAGPKAKSFISHLKQKNIVPEFIIVSDIAKNPTEIDGIKVIELSEAEELLRDKSILIAVVEQHHQDIMKNLFKCNYKECIPISDKWEEYLIS
ncbi:MAG: glycosyltransferase family 8 protein [Lachnospiraceae bacterium]|nr:glycosyltransferase family 8 protein [Lachnospiraceae bacterium]